MSKVAARAMVLHGFKQVFRMKGNITAWEAAGFPVEKATLEVLDAPRPGDELAIPEEVVRDFADDGPSYVEEIVWDVDVTPPDPTFPANESFAD